MGTRKWVDLAVGVIASVHPGIGPMQPAEIQAHQEERAAEQRQMQLERDTDVQTRSHYVPADTRPFGAGTEPRAVAQPGPAQPAPTPANPVRKDQVTAARDRVQRRDRSR